jgi:hypothetical protein
MTIFYTREDARRALAHGSIRAINSRRQPARLFRFDGGSTYTATVPGGNGLTYVRIFQGESIQLTQAIDRIGVSSPADDDKPVYLDVDTDGNLIIYEFRYEGT